MKSNQNVFIQITMLIRILGHNETTVKKPSIFNIMLGLWVAMTMRCDMPSENRPPELSYPPGIYYTPSSQVKISTLDISFTSNSVKFFFSQGDSNIIAISNSAITRIPADLSEFERIYYLPPDFSKFSNPFVSQNRNFLSFTSSRGDNEDLYLLNLHSLELTQLTDTPDTDERYPRFSTDDSSLVYAAESRTGLETITTLNLNTSTVDTVISGHYQNTASINGIRFPAFIENNTRVFYEQFTNPSGTVSDTLFTVNIDGKDKKALETQTVPLGEIAVSQDGSQIVYTRWGNPMTLVTIKNDGTGYHEISSTFGVSGDGFSVSDDGHKILFWVKDNAQLNAGYTNLFTIDRNGTNRKLVSSGHNGKYSSDRSLIIFSAIVENY